MNYKQKLFRKGSVLLTAVLLSAAALIILGSVSFIFLNSKIKKIKISREKLNNQLMFSAAEKILENMKSDFLFQYSEEKNELLFLNKRFIYSVKENYYPEIIIEFENLKRRFVLGIPGSTLSDYAVISKTEKFRFLLDKDAEIIGNISIPLGVETGVYPVDSDFLPDIKGEIIQNEESELINFSSLDYESRLTEYIHLLSNPFECGTDYISEQHISGNEDFSEIFSSETNYAEGIIFEKEAEVISRSIVLSGADIIIEKGCRIKGLTLAADGNIIIESGSVLENVFLYSGNRITVENSKLRGDFTSRSSFKAFNGTEIFYPSIIYTKGTGGERGESVIEVLSGSKISGVLISDYPDYSKNKDNIIIIDSDSSVKGLIYSNDDILNFGSIYGMVYTKDFVDSKGRNINLLSNGRITYSKNYAVPYGFSYEFYTLAEIIYVYNESSY